MRETKYFYEYLNNENPFAFLKGYEKNKFLEEKTKKRLDSVQKLQPKFIPCAIEPNIFSTEHNHAMNTFIKNGINQHINNGMWLLKEHNVDFDQSLFEQIGSTNINNDEYVHAFCEVGYNKDHRELKFNLVRLDEILDLFKRYSFCEDIIIEIYRLKLLNKQNIIRNKVYEALRDKVDDETIANIDFDKPIHENPIEIAKRVIELESKTNK
ncbi:hypothetical protein NGRA_1053 [Nosema granulosis]|uniref:Uncharacterized protein n=1 Tax=Nosema granulosis TaxID=83296 RepID=A0A9P6GZN2_9MICR|nr:hypothetical protein NGRA_1053 [Nosema granulosis]